MRDSPTIGNNSSGSTRTDLVYAVISYGTATTETVRQKPLSGSTPVSVSLTTQKDILVTIAVVAGVASGDPLVRLPTDDTVNGVYNFGLAALAIPNGFSGGAIDQAVITPLWVRGFASRQRVQTYRAGTLIGSGIAEAPLSSAVSARNGAGLRILTWMYNFFPATAIYTNDLSTWPTLDDSIDWRYRQMKGDLDRLHEHRRLFTDA